MKVYIESITPRYFELGDIEEQSREYLLENVDVDYMVILNNDELSGRVKIQPNDYKGMTMSSLEEYIRKQLTIQLQD